MKRKELKIISCSTLVVALFTLIHAPAKLHAAGEDNVCYCADDLVPIGRRQVINNGHVIGKAQGAGCNRCRLDCNGDVGPGRTAAFAYNQCWGNSGNSNTCSSDDSCSFGQSNLLSTGKKKN